MAKQKVGQKIVNVNPYREMSNKVTFLSDQVRLLRQGVSKIYRIWDRFFKTIGVIISVLIVSGLWAAGYKLYWMNGKWPFVTVVFGVILALIILGLLVWLTWQIVNAALVNKINELE